MANLKYKNSNNQWKSLSVIRGPKGDNANILLNGTSSNNISIYAPTSSGLSGQILQSNGANEKPTWVEHQIPTVNNAILTIQKNESLLGTFSANANENQTINIEVPTIEDILNKVYPIGSIFISLNETNPKILFGGEWEAIQDKFLISSGWYTSGTTGGAASHSHTLSDSGYAKSSMHGDGLIRHRELSGLPAWEPNYKIQATSGSADSGFNDPYGIGLGGNTDVSSTLPPFLAVYMWKRTA